MCLQLCNHLAAAKHRGEHQRRHAATVVGVNVGTVFEQRGNNFFVAFESRAAQRGLSTIIPVVRVRTMLQQQAMARSTKDQRLREVEAIKVHHLVPGRDKVVNKFLLRVRASVHFRQGAELGV